MQVLSRVDSIIIRKYQSCFAKVVIRFCRYSGLAAVSKIFCLYVCRCIRTCNMCSVRNCVCTCVYICVYMSICTSLYVSVKDSITAVCQEVCGYYDFTLQYSLQWMEGVQQRAQLSEHGICCCTTSPCWSQL